LYVGSRVNCKIWRKWPVLALALAPVQSLAAQPYIAPQPLSIFTAPSSRQPDLAARILAAHNAERRKFGLPALEWDDRLAQEAQQWAAGLAHSGQLQHSSAEKRRGAGENLFIGTAGAYRVEAMIDFFLEERRDFKPGTFPQVARNGDWTSVGHYTQIIWRDTRRVGCGLAKANGNEAMVCRYVPAGNIYGGRVP
jgi:hypothetical protein